MKKKIHDLFIVVAPSLRRKQWRTSPTLLNANNLLNNRKLFFFFFFFFLEEFSGRCCCENSVSRTRFERNGSTKRSRPRYDTCQDDHLRCLNHSQASKQTKLIKQTNRKDLTNHPAFERWQDALYSQGRNQWPVRVTVKGQTSNPLEQKWGNPIRTSKIICCRL